ncbi:MAG: leucine-rich repeat protein, partial [Ruminococcus sp.]
PTLSVQAAETQALENVVENYTDIENSEYKITNVECYDYSMYVYYSVPQDCEIVMAVFDGVTGRIIQMDTNNLYAPSNRYYNGYVYFGFNNYGNRKFTYKLFIVDSDNRPLGKSYSGEKEVTGYSESPSFWCDMEIEPHPTVPLKEDSGKCGYNADWSVNTDGVLTIDGEANPYYPAENAMPWNEYREGITSVVFKNPPYSFGRYLLQGLSKVKEITIPDVSYVDMGCIQDMASLETIYIGSYTDSIYDGAFINCPALKNFVVDEASEYFKSVDGVLYSKDGTTLMRYPSGRTDKTFIIPDTVDYIDGYAFEGAKNLETIVMSDNVTYINNYAFKDCTSLANVTLSANVSGISEGAFSNCSSLKSIVLPENLNYIGLNCFENTAIEEINIFGQTDEISFDFLQTLPDTLKRITVDAENTYFTVDNGVLFNADKTNLLKYPCGASATSYTVPESVTSIESGAFANCKNLENITIGDNVQNIGESAFENCSNLKSIALTNVEVISSYLFQNCTSLESVSLGNATEIYNRAFNGCKSLETVTIPASVRYINNNIFAHCDSLESINVEDGNSNYRTVDDCLYNGTCLMEYPNAKASSYTVSTETTKIASYAFSGRASLTSITIPDSVTNVDSYAFSDCTNLKNVSLPESISSINYYTFYNCTSLSSIVIPDSVGCLDSCAFQNCKSLKSVELPSNDYCYLSDRAFSGTGLESITIPKNIELYYNVFAGSHSLKSIKFMGDAYSYSPYLTFWNFDDLTIYYPKSNSTWTSEKMVNYEHKDSLKWVAYDDGSPDYMGKHTFTGLEPNCEYIVGVNDGTPSDGLLSYNNTLYIDQLTADSKGEITMNYTLRYNTSNIVPFALGTAKYDISNAFPFVSDIVYTGKAQDKPDNYSVTFDGKELTEGVDYLVVDGSGFDGAGYSTFSVVGIGNYYGTASYGYIVLGTEYDVDCDGMITVRDATAIQLYLAGIRELGDEYAADVNCDGEITVDDVTCIQKLLAGLSL